MLITVVIPAHDRPQLLMEAVRSVAQQTFSDCELVVIDDGSQPPIDRIALEACFGGRLIFRRHEVAQGVSKTKNAGVREAHGDVILLLDDDDLLLPRALEVVAGAFEKYPELDCVFMGVEPFGAWADGPIRNRQRTLQRLIQRAKPEERDGLLVFTDNLFEALIGRVPIDFQRPAARRSVWRRIGGFAEDALFAESAWAVLASLECRVALTQEALTRWRIHQDNFGWPSHMSDREIAERNNDNALRAAHWLGATVGRRAASTKRDKRICAEYIASLYMAKAYGLRERGVWKGLPCVLRSLGNARSISSIRAVCGYFVPRGLIY